MKSVATLLASAAAATAVTIAEINGNKFLSPYNGQNVTDVKGLVTAIGTNGIFLRSTEPDEDPATSEGLFVFSTPIRGQVKVGDIITLNGRVTEYR
jgi:predicted extracellular nuclease